MYILMEKLKTEHLVFAKCQRLMDLFQKRLTELCSQVLTFHLKVYPITK